MNCEACNKELMLPNDRYRISVFEEGDALISLDTFCSWYCASSIINEKADQERETERAGA